MRVRRVHRVRRIGGQPRITSFRLIGIGLVGVLALSACGSDGDGSSGDDATASPLSDLMGWSDYDPVEQRRQSLAIEEAIGECMREEGFEYVPQDYDSQFDSGQGEEDFALMQDGPEAYGEKYGYGVVRNYEIYEEPYIGEGGGGNGGPIFEDPNQDYVSSLSQNEQQTYYEVLYGAPQEDPSFDDTDPDGTQAMYMPTLEEQGCSGRAQSEVVGDTPMNDPEIQEALNDVFSMWEDDPRLETAENDWLDCMGDAAADFDLPEAMAIDGVDSMYQIMEALKALAMGQDTVPLDPDTGMPVGDFDEMNTYSSFQNEDGTGFAVIGEQTLIPDDELERLRSDELALWKKDWGCQQDAGILDVQRAIEQEGVDDLLARFPQLGEQE